MPFVRFSVFFGQFGSNLELSLVQNQSSQALEKILLKPQPSTTEGCTLLSNFSKKALFLYFLRKKRFFIAFVKKSAYF